MVVTTLSENPGYHVYQLSYTSPIFPTGSHTVQFKNMGGSGPYMTVDALSIFTMFDDSDPGWAYAGGTWLTYSASGPFNNTEHYSNVLNGTASFTFSGSRFVLYYSGDSNRSNVQVKVDGLVVTTFSENPGAHVYQLTYTSPAFSAGTHTVLFTNVGPSGKYMTIDAIKILP